MEAARGREREREWDKKEAQTGPIAKAEAVADNNVNDDDWAEHDDELDEEATVNSFG